MKETMVEVCVRRIRANPAGLTIYEHEIPRLAEELAGMTRNGRPSAAEIEVDIRDGFFRFMGLPVRPA